MGETMSENHMEREPNERIKWKELNRKTNVENQMEQKIQLLKLVKLSD